MTKYKNKYSHRFLARIIIEAATPMAVGAGDKDVVTDSIVATDVNGLPYIPATAIAGVLRSMVETELTKNISTDNKGGEWDKEKIKRIFGFQEKNSGQGSEIIFSEAKILDHTGKPVDGMKPEAIAEDPLLMNYQSLPVRQHVRMTHKGVAADKGKFDNQIVFPGSRFCFEVEMVSEGDNRSLLNSVLSKLYDKSLRIGSGSRCGLGEIKVVDLKTLDLDLNDNRDLDIYLDKSSSLDSNFWKMYEDKVESLNFSDDVDGRYIFYDLRLTPDSFFLFGSGFSDNEVDMTPVRGEKVVWKEKDGRMEAHLEKNLVLIPATSVKGALAHRVAFHWNRINGIFADKISPEEIEKCVESCNEAVTALFGSDGNNDNRFIRGNVMISDIILKDKLSDKIFNHVTVDRYTGAGIEGALFSEKATYGEGKNFDLKIIVDDERIKKDYPSISGKVLEAFEACLQDLCNGRLPLGGGVNRGHGVFHGSIVKK